MPFNLYKHNNSKKYAISLPNGTTTIDLPNGQGPGVNDGIQLTDQNGSSFQNEAPEDNDLQEIIGDILYESSNNKDEDEIKNIASRAMNINLPKEFSGQDDLAKMVLALGRRASEDQNTQLTNLETGEKEQSISNLASSIAKMAGWDIESLINDAKQRKEDSIENNQTNFSPIKISKKRTPVDIEREKEVEEKEKEDPAGKHKKGNPFKVLMGLVGKMLDHGMGKREIVRKILRQENNKWKPETIEKCIKVVKDARKKETKKKLSSTHFNFYKYSQSKNIDNSEKRESIYDIHRNIKLMSTMELVSRMGYLNAVSSFDAGLLNENNPGNKQLKGKQYIKDLKQVKDELSNRNYSKEQIEILSKIIHDNQSDN